MNKSFLKSNLLALVLLFGATLLSPSLARQVATSPNQQSESTATSTKSMVATVHPLATTAGVNAMEQGGNAVDAAIAAALTLGVVDNFNSGIGGGCFILIRKPNGDLFAIDGREMAPAASTKDMFIGKSGASQTGALASGVPGALAAFHQAVTQHGKSKFAELVLPAAEIAANGFPLSKVYESRLKSAASKMADFAETKAIFFHNKMADNKTADNNQPAEPKTAVQPVLVPYTSGQILKQPDLATTYRQIAKHGHKWFYNGQFANMTEAWMKQNNGIMTSRDFANYKTVDRTPVKTSYRGYEIVGFPPPSSGGVHVAQVLSIVEQFDLKKLHNEDPAKMYHVIAEAMKIAFADRAHWLGDPDYVNVPSGLVAKQYAVSLAKQIDFSKTTEVNHGTPPSSDTEFFEKHTTHIAAADREGNWVAITSTVNTTFGAKYVIPGTGVIMNNQMDDFVADPSKPNAFGLMGGDNNSVAAGKRPLSSMSPTIVLKDGQPIMTVGAAGGPKIITQAILAIINHIDLEMPIGQAIAKPRIHHQWSPNQLLLETSFSETIAKRLAERGHVIKRARSMGISQGITYDSKTGIFTGTHDPRTTGKAAGQ